MGKLHGVRENPVLAHETPQPYGQVRGPQDVRANGPLAGSNSIFASDQWDAGNDAVAAAAAAAADAGVQDGGVNAGVPVLTQVTVNADPGCRIPHPVREALAKTGAMRVAERALLLHHLLGNLHIHDARTSDEFDRGKFLGLMVEELGGSRGHEAYAGDDGGRLGTAFRNLGALHKHVGADLPAGTVAAHDVQIVQTLIDEWRCHLPGGGGAEAAAAAAAASAAAAAPKPKNDPDDVPVATLA